jgi:pilus assembly protein TadC
VIAAAGLAVAVAVALAGRRAPPAASRLRAVFTEPGYVEPADQEQRSPLRLLLAAVVLVAGMAMLGGAGGLVAGGIGAVAVTAIRPRRRSACVAPDDVPIVVDLVAGCLDAGATLPAALDAVASAIDGVMALRCRAVARALRSGSTPAEAWQSWLSDPSLAPAARTATRTASSGAAAADDLRRTARRLRARRRSRAHHRVRQASVWLVVPLGICFLPAFVLVAVVPIVVGLVPSLR